MDISTKRTQHVAAIADIIRHITWQGHKHSLQTLSRPDIALTMPQMVTLFAIRDTGSCRMSELAEITQQSAGTLTGIVDRLIEDGLVARVRDAEDRRVVQVVLTQMGQERIHHVERARCADMARVLRYFTLEQLAQLEEYLYLLARGIEQTFLEDTLTTAAGATNAQPFQHNHTTTPTPAAEQRSSASAQPKQTVSSHVS